VQVAELLGERGEIGDGLGGVLVDAERVDDGEATARAESAHLLDRAVGTDDQGVQVLTEHPRRVLERLSGDELKVVPAEGDGVRAEAGRPRPEGRSGTGRRLAEVDADRAPGESPLPDTIATELHSASNDARQVVRGKIRQRDQIAHDDVS